MKVGGFSPALARGGNDASVKPRPREWGTGSATGRDCTWSDALLAVETNKKVGHSWPQTSLAITIYFHSMIKSDKIGLPPATRRDFYPARVMGSE